MSQRVALAAVSLALAVALPAAADEAVPSAEWRAFEGSWSISGRRQTVATEGGAEAAIVEWRGAVALTRGDGLGRGFPQCVNGVLVEDRHIDVGDFGQDKQHHGHDDAAAQADFTLWPQMPGHDADHRPGARGAYLWNAAGVGRGH